MFHFRLRELYFFRVRNSSGLTWLELTINLNCSWIVNFTIYKCTISLRMSEIAKPDLKIRDIFKYILISVTYLLVHITLKYWRTLIKIKKIKKLPTFHFLRSNSLVLYSIDFISCLVRFDRKDILKNVY